jgi:hypothetical protein
LASPLRQLSAMDSAIGSGKMFHSVEVGKVVKSYFSKLPDPADHPVFILTPQLSLRSR